METDTGFHAGFTVRNSSAERNHSPDNTVRLNQTLIIDQDQHRCKSPLTTSLSIPTCSQIPMHESAIRSASDYMIDNSALTPDLSSNHRLYIENEAGHCSSLQNIIDHQPGINSPTSSLVTLEEQRFNGSASVDADLLVRVDRPEKVMTTLDTYITFAVVTKTRRSDFLDANYEARRRFSDFVWLRNRLEQEWPMLLIPPLPEKHSLYTLERFEPNFVKNRCYLLHLFLQSLVVIPRLNRHEHLRMFLTADLDSLVAYRKAEPSLHSVTEMLFSFATNRQANCPGKEFEDNAHQCQELSRTVSALEKWTGRLQLAEKQTVVETEALAAIMGHWAETDHSAALATGAEAVKRALDAVVDANKSDASFHMQIGLLWRHWAFYADGAKTVLRRRDSVQCEQISTDDSLMKKTGERETCRQSLKCDAGPKATSIDMRREWTRWNSLRTDQLRDTLKTMAEHRLDMHRKQEKKADDLSNELEKYLAEFASNIPKSNFDTCQFWHLDSIAFLFLSELALKILAIPANSAPVERVFSNAGLCSSNRKNRIGPKLLEMKCLLQMNLLDYPDV